MDDKTAELRDIFIDATGSDSVTESQSESPGSLTDTDTDVTDRLLELIGRMRERYTFENGFDDETLSRIVQWYYTDCTDREIAAELEADPEAVFAARLDLHLVDEVTGQLARDAREDGLREATEDIETDVSF